MKNNNKVDVEGPGMFGVDYHLFLIAVVISSKTRSSAWRLHRSW